MKTTREYTTVDGQTVTLNYVDGYNIGRWYKEIWIAGSIMQCSEFGISDEEEALEIASDAVDIIEGSPVFEENEYHAIEAAVEKNKGNKNMKKFKIAIEESQVKEFDVYAKNAKEAMAKLEKEYHDSKLDLSDMVISNKQMSIVAPDDEAMDWVEF